MTNNEKQQTLTERERALVSQAVQKTQERINRFPALIPLIGSFGVVTIFYGMEKLLDRTSLGQHPILAILIGVVILLLIGVYFKKL